MHCISHLTETQISLGARGTELRDAERKHEAVDGEHRIGFAPGNPETLVHNIDNIAQISQPLAGFAL